MSNSFKTIGLIGRQRKDDIKDTLETLKNFLLQKKHHIVVDSETATIFSEQNFPTYPRDELGKHCDLIIVVGGDGSLLNAVRAGIHSNTPLLGINKGRLGFLTDIHPDELENKISEVLAGKYLEEKRFLLSAKIELDNQIIAQDMALNDVVLMPGDVAHMIEFAITINEQFVFTQRADGLIVATPTGSTAYALSGGGPILHPQLDAIVLVPMFPHTLSARPIVLAGNDKIKITIDKDADTMPQLSCDGQARISLAPGCNIHISKKAEQIRIIHPHNYNYFKTLREKLHWSTK